MWRFAFEHGRDFVAFLRSFGAIRRGFASGAFRYAVIVAERPAERPVPRPLEPVDATTAGRLPAQRR